MGQRKFIAEVRLIDNELKEVMVPAFIVKNRNNDGTFKEGFTPWNKGTKGIQLGGVQTQFKPGHLPINTKYNGYKSIRTVKRGIQYVFIRASKGRFVPLHRLNYQKKYGDIPKGMILRSKDGNSLNCNPDNWELITRAEHLKRNYNHPQHSISMGKLWNSEKLRKRVGLPQLTKLKVLNF